MKALVTILLSGIIFSSFGQNWQMVNSSRTSFYGYKKWDNRYQDTATIVEGLRIDSIAINNSDSIFSNYVTSYEEGWNCQYDDTSWIGANIIIDSLGINFFVSKLLDTFQIIPRADSGDIWSFSDSITAQVDSIYYGVVLDTVQDSIKVISLSNGGIIKLSKKYGFIEGYRFGYYPEDITKMSLTGIEGFAGIQNLTSDMIFDFEIGDEFHYVNQTRGEPNIYTGGFYCESSTKWVSIINDLSEVPSDPFLDTLPNYSISNSRITFELLNNDSVKIKTIRERCTLASWYHIYQEGIGLTYSATYNESDKCSSTTELVYYKKANGEVWGVPLSSEQLMLNEVQIHPNPVINELKISNPTRSILEAQIVNALGEIINVAELQSQVTINCTNWESGLYFLKLFNNNGEFIGVQKFIKK